jgi:hypothetical protein
VLVLGCSLLLAGLTLVILVIHLTSPAVSGWAWSARCCSPG